MADKVLLLTRLLAARRDSGFDTLRAHILLEIETLAVIGSQFVQVLLLRLVRGLKITQTLCVEVADLHWVPHVEVELIRMETEPLHL